LEGIEMITQTAFNRCVLRVTNLIETLIEFEGITRQEAIDILDIAKDNVKRRKE
jgi:hypothetical protein